MTDLVDIPIETVVGKLKRPRTRAESPGRHPAAPDWVPGARRDAPNIEWQKMVDFDVRVVWEIIQDHLPPLKAFVERRIQASN
jgi:hypothetical protein